MVLCFAVMGLVAISPAQQASATISWPLELETYANNAKVLENGSVIAASCINGDNRYASARIVGDNDPVYDFPLSGTNFTCWQDRLSAAISDDGTLYGTVYNSSTTISSFSAVKNGRVKWSTPLAWADDCPNGGPAWNNYSGSNIRNVSIGADGNIYLIAAPDALYCDAFLLGFDAYTGEIIQRIGLGTMSGWESSYNLGVWTYDDYIIAIDSSRMKHVYGYGANSEILSQQYQFTIDTNYVHATVANEDGRVFVISGCGVGGTIYYSDLNGSHGEMPRNDCGYMLAGESYFPGPNGTLASSSPHGNVYLHDPTVAPNGSTQTLNSASHISDGYVQNYSHGITHAFVDEEGDFLVTKSLAKDINQAESGVFIEYVDNDSLVTPSVLLAQEGDGTAQDRPITLGLIPAVSDEYLYSPVYYGYDGVTYVNDNRLHRTDITGTDFGTPVPQGPGFAEPSDEREYVAMGDSFSSGEGVEPFITGSANDGTNECHRSKDAYSVLLAQEEDLDLNLVDFVACSGATTQNVLHGGSGTGAWDEPAQIDALSDSTKVVTITIGGNDAGFKEYILGCVAVYCGPGSLTYEAITDLAESSAFYNNLVSTYEDILEAAPNAEIYVSDYPYVIADPPYSCGIGIYAIGTRGVQDAINEAIRAAVEDAGEDDESLHFMTTNYEGSPFEGHSLCEQDMMAESYFNPADALNIEYSFHPNGIGQDAYFSVFNDHISE